MIHRFRRISSKSLVAGNIAGHDAAGADDRMFADDQSAEDRTTRSDRRPTADPRFEQFPVSLPLRLTIATRRARIAVIGKHHPVADEYLVLDGHSLANKRVAGDLAACADPDSLLDFHEATDASLIADFAAVEIHESMQPHIPAQADVGCDPQAI